MGVEMAKNVLTVEMSLTAADGTVLRSTSETGLARMWAAHVWGEAWMKVSPTRRRIEIDAALDEIHFACARAEPVDAA
jgi:hypothetical protein